MPRTQGAAAAAAAEQLPPGELAAEAQRFVEDTGALFRSLGSNRDVGRIYAYFLIKSAPATLNDLEAALHISKSAASTATRILESSSVLVRARVPGSRKRVYGMEGSPAVIFAGALETMRQVERLLGRAQTLAEDDSARARTRFVSDYVQSYVELVESFLKPGLGSSLPRQETR